MIIEDLQPGEGREGHRPAHHAARKHDQDTDDGADDQDHREEDDRRKHRGWVFDRGGFTMQVSPENEHPAAYTSAVGEGEVTAEDQYVAGHRPIEKNIPGDNAHVTRALSLYISGTKKAAGIMKFLVWCQHYVTAKPKYIRRRLCRTSQ